MSDLRKCLIERRMVEVDPGKAKHYLTFNIYDRQRRIRLPHVDDLANKMAEGKFRFGDIAFVSINGSRDILVNGQHVCSAIVQADSTMPCMVEKFKAKDELEASEIYRQFEILPRSLADMVSVEALALGLDWPIWVASVVVGAAVLEKTLTKKGTIQKSVAGRGISTYASKGYITKEDKVNLLGKYLDEGGFVSYMLTDGVTKKEVAHIRKTALVYTMFKTWQKDHTAANAFWTNVRDGEHLDKGSPEMKLRNFLLLAGLESINSKYKKRSISNNEYVYRSFLAWNAFRTGKNTNMAYSVGKPLPKLI